MLLRPFFCYHGGKWRSAPKYPAPEHPLIIEPFAGAAGYSTRHPDHQIHLYDIDPMIVNLWTWLIAVSSAEILALPIVNHIDDLPDRVSEEARTLIGFWFSKGTAHPRRTMSKWKDDYRQAASFWGPQIRKRIAQQVQHIRHWQIEQRSFEEVANSEATWFIDPPYSKVTRKYYRHSQVDYTKLATWCQERSGQTIVCESADATWLPFTTLGQMKAIEGRNGTGISNEGIWVNGKIETVTPIL